jgi:hypothetical protein
VCLCRDLWRGYDYYGWGYVLTLYSLVYEIIGWNDGMSLNSPRVGLDGVLDWTLDLNMDEFGLVIPLCTNCVSFLSCFITRMLRSPSEPAMDFGS